MKPFSYQAFVDKKNSELSSQNIKTSRSRRQDSISFSSISPTKISWIRIQPSKVILAKRLQKLFKKHKRQAFFVINIKSNKKQLKVPLLQNKQKRFLMCAFIAIRKSTQRNKKPKQPKKENDNYESINKILCMKIYKLAKIQQNKGFNSIKQVAFNRYRINLLSDTLKNRQCIINQRLKKLFFHKIILKINLLKNNQKIAKSMKRIIQKISQKFKKAVFKQIITYAISSQNYKWLLNRAESIRQAQNQYHQRNKYINKSKDALKEAKFALEAESAERNVTKTQLVKQMNEAKRHLKQFQKQKIQQFEQKEQYYAARKHYLVRLQNILQKRNKSRQESRGMHKKVLDLYKRIEEKSANVTDKWYKLPQTRDIQNQDEFFLYQNQKLRQTVLLYDRGNSVFDKWPQEQKVFNENYALKILIASIIARTYQKTWTKNFLNQF